MTNSDSSWEKNMLNDIVLKFVSGGTPSTSNPGYWGGDIHWMRSAVNLGKEVLTGEKTISEQGLKNSSTNIVPKDNILIASRVSLGNLFINRVDMAISQDLTGLILDKRVIDENFLYYLLNKQNNRILSLAQGSTIKGILRKDLENFVIERPPLVEQRGIAEVLGTVDEAIRVQEQVIATTMLLKQGLMQRLLTEGIGHTE